MSACGLNIAWIQNLLCIQHTMQMFWIKKQI
jgi:hypothetical protein